MRAMTKAEKKPRYAAAHAGHFGSSAMAAAEPTEAPEAPILLESVAKKVLGLDSNARGSKPVGPSAK